MRHSHGREAQRAPDPGSWRGQPSTLDALLDCERIATAAAIDAVRAALHTAGKVERGSAVLQHTSHTGWTVYSRVASLSQTLSVTRSEKRPGALPSLRNGG